MQKTQHPNTQTINSIKFISQNNPINQKSKTKYTKLNKIIPHTTKVAAWISADTGIGPSIASGNQMCRPNCDDLLKAQKDNKTINNPEI